MRRLPLLLGLLVLAPGCPVFGDVFFEDDLVGETGIGPGVPCLDSDAADALEAHLQSVEHVLTMGAAAAGADTAVVWTDVPGIPRADWYTLQLDTACPDAGPSAYCTAGACYAVECVGDDGSWQAAITLDPEAEADTTLFGDAEVAALVVTLTWAPATGALTLHTTTDGLYDAQGRDWSSDGASLPDAGAGWSLGLPGLHEWGTVEVRIADGTGTVSIPDGELATWADGALTPSPDCF